MTPIESALRAADLHIPDAAGVIREHLEAQAMLISSYRSDAERICSCPWRVQKGVEALCQPPKNMREALDRAEQAERERDALRALLAEAIGWNWLDDDLPPEDLRNRIDTALDGVRANG